MKNARFLKTVLPVAPVSSATAEAPGNKDSKSVTEEEVTIATCGALSGRVSETGNIIRDGVKLYFDYINEKVGIDKRKLNLVGWDAVYDPEKAIECFNGCLKDKDFAATCRQSSQTMVKYLRIDEGVEMPMVGFFPGTTASYRR